jgi:glycosyltransferase involved in cell wall biosynthesis
LGNSIFVIVPAFNEREIIVSTVQRLIGAGYSVVLVDDGSTDGTADLVADLPLYFLRHSINLGQGAALQTGMTFALQNGAEIIVHFDADGQHQVEDIEMLMRPLREGEADIVLGSRFLRERDISAVPRKKRVLLRAAVFVNWLTTGLWLTDAHNGLRALTCESAKKIHLSENGFAHATEILGEVSRAHLRYVERPTSISYTDYSKAKGQPVWNAFNIVVDLFLRGMFK